MPYPAPAPVYLGPPHKKSAGSNKPIKRIVMHGTVSPTERGGARQIAAYFRSANAGGSAHYVVDPGEVVQTGYDSVVCWHAPPNQGSLGVELCDWVGGGPNRGTPLPLVRWRDEAHRAMLERAAKLVAELCLAYGVPVRMVGPLRLRAGLRGICEHSDVSQAWGQSSHWDLGNFPRRRFIRLVKANVKAIKRGEECKPKRPSKAVQLADRAQQAHRNKTQRAASRREQHTDTTDEG